MSWFSTDTFAGAMMIYSLCYVVILAALCWLDEFNLIRLPEMGGARTAVVVIAGGPFLWIMFAVWWVESRWVSWIENFARTLK